MARNNSRKPREGANVKPKNGANVKPKIEKEDIPKGFIKQKRGLNTFQYGNYKGRKYKVLKNGCGMWADTGKVFKLSDLD